MDREAFAHHLTAPLGAGWTHPDAAAGAAGGAVCGDLVTMRVRVAGERVAGAGFDAEGCGALTAAASAAVALARGAPLLVAARVNAAAIAGELGGLSPGKHHAAELAADALHRALGAAAASAAALPAAADRTLVAMSGGVDSAVAALLVTRGGREAVGVTVELWRDADNDPEGSCCSASAVRLARAVAHGMGMAHLTLDLRDAFRAGVVEPWLAAHAAGETPNPCVRCNGAVRLDAMVALADRLGAADLATGHYARVAPPGPLLRAAADANKDQSYMLAALAPRTLARLRFPLGELAKPQVRALAAAAELPVAQRAESQDLCFLAGTTHEAFLAKHGALGERPGPVVDEHGRPLGTHRGAHRLTVGQRRGLGIGAPQPLYVLRKEGDTVTVGPRERLATRRVRVRDAVLHRPCAEVDAVKLRYRSHPLACTATADGDALVLDLHDGARGGAAPGQVAVLLAGDVIVGQGTIAARAVA